MIHSGSNILHTKFYLFSFMWIFNEDLYRLDAAVLRMKSGERLDSPQTKTSEQSAGRAPPPSFGISGKTPHCRIPLKWCFFFVHLQSWSVIASMIWEFEIKSRNTKVVQSGYSTPSKLAELHPTQRGRVGDKQQLQSWHSHFQTFLPEILLYYSSNPNRVN